MATGTQGHLGLKQEATYGQEATPPEVYGRFFSESIAMNNKLIRPRTVNGTRFTKRALAGSVSAGGGVSMALSPEGIVPWFVKGLLGGVSTEMIASGVYEHVYAATPGCELPSFTVQVDQDAACQNWLGCVVSGATLSVAPNAELGFDVNLVSQRPKLAVAGTPSFPDVDLWVASGVSFSFNGENRLDYESFKLSIDNNIEQVYTLNGQRWPSAHVTKGLEVSGTVTFAFSSDAELRRFWGAADATTPLNTLMPASLTLTATHSDEIAPGYNYSLAIELPEVYYTSAPANITSATDRILQTVAFVANFNAASGKVIGVTLRNGESGYPDPA
jgi:hypothetical protein